MDGTCWVFLLLAFTHLGHECQDLLSMCDGIHVCIDLGLYFERILGNGVRTHVNSKGKILKTERALRKVKLVMLHQRIVS